MFTSDSMITVSRRHFLAGAAALAALAPFPLRIAAALEPHKFKHGEFEITVVSDGHLTLPAKVLAPDAPPAELEALLKAAGIPTDNVQVATNATLIRTGSDLIVFDTGSGGNFQPTAGKLVENLTAAGIDPGSVTKVVFTHGHPDHLGGTVAPAGALHLPNAAYYATSAEWDFWMDKDIFAKMPKEMHPFAELAQKQFGGTKERVTMLKPGDDIVTGVRVLDTAGHTPGHASFEVAGEDGLIIIGDAIASPAVHFPHPEWRFGFDGIPELAIANRRKLLERAATEKTKLIGFHWPYPGIGRAEQKDTAYHFVAA